jgi:hypothetical protein
LKKRRRRQHVVIFFCGGVVEKKKTMAMCRCFFLWCCCSKEGDGNLLPSLSSLVGFKQKRQQQFATIAFFDVREEEDNDNVQLSSFVVLLEQRS